MDPLISTNALRYIPVAKPSLSSAEVKAVAKTVRDGWISQGPRVAEFEQVFAEAHGKKFGVACNSGTSALQLAMAVKDIGPGDKVLCPTMSMVACPNAILYVGAEPVFVDSSPLTGLADLSEVTAKIGMCEAALAVHLYGLPSAVHRIVDRSLLIEDCAESHYARFPSDYGGGPVGSAGDLACFSFYANKIIACGEGGMVLTDCPDQAERLRTLRAHAFTPGEHFSHRGLAYGYRMCDMQAALGLAQHRRRTELLSRRQEIAERYLDRLSDVHWIIPQPHTRGSVWWVFPILLAAPRQRDRLRVHLARAGVETRTWFKPMHLQPHLRQFATGEQFPVAEDLYNRGLYLPLYPDLRDEDVDCICEVVRSF